MSSKYVYTTSITNIFTIGNQCFEICDGMIFEHEVYENYLSRGRLLIAESSLCQVYELPEGKRCYLKLDN